MPTVPRLMKIPLPWISRRLKRRLAEAEERLEQAAYGSSEYSDVEEAEAAANRRGSGVGGVGGIVAGLEAVADTASESMDSEGKKAYPPQAVSAESLGVVAHSEGSGSGGGGERGVIPTLIRTTPVDTTGIPTHRRHRRLRGRRRHDGNAEETESQRGAKRLGNGGGSPAQSRTMDAAAPPPPQLKSSQAVAICVFVCVGMCLSFLKVFLSLQREQASL